MENETFQERIKAKAITRLHNDLYNASQKLLEVGNLIEHDFSEILNVRSYYGYSSRQEIVIEKGKDIFEKLLPRYIGKVTDEILQKVDEIDWLISNKNQEQDY